MSVALDVSAFLLLRAWGPTAEECQDRCPSLAKVHGRCEQEDLKDSVASVHTFQRSVKTPVSSDSGIGTMIKELAQWSALMRSSTAQILNVVSFALIWQYPTLVYRLRRRRSGIETAQWPRMHTPMGACLDPWSGCTRGG